jgi:hypothetical protein
MPPKKEALSIVWREPRRFEGEEARFTKARRRVSCIDEKAL